MQIIRNETGLEAVRGPVLTLGNFDGVHLGHRQIIGKVVARAATLGVPSAVYTFDPHPLKVVAPEKSPPLILDLDDKTRLISELGVDYLLLAEFTKEFASKHPREFVEELMVRRLAVREVWVGHDYSFGRGREGTGEYLARLGGELGFDVFIVPAYTRLGAVVSSSRIRRLLFEGGVRKAAALLGRDYTLKGRVVRGRNAGKEIGFPTANIETTSEITPADGVYSARALAGGQWRDAVVNIGKAPTFGENARTVEVHIMDFTGNIYGEQIEVSFDRRIRGERRFKNAGELAERIAKDVERARSALSRGRDAAGAKRPGREKSSCR